MAELIKLRNYGSWVEIHTNHVYNINVMLKHDLAGTHKRVNVTLPPATLQLIDRVALKGNRSRFVDDAVRYYVKTIGRSALKKQLKAGALGRAQRDVHLTEEWFFIDNEAWRNNQK